MDLQSELKHALDDLLNSGAVSALESLIDSHPEAVARKSGDYPDFHRIVDIQIGTKHYRICRQISAGEVLTVLPIEEALDSPGVPIWLQGEKLRSWARIEEENPSDDPTDWELYR